MSTEPDSTPRPVAKSRSTPAPLLLDLVEIVVLALILFAVINFAAETVRVIGVSMEPTLQNNDWLIASKIDLRFTTPSRGQIVILRDPYDPTKDFIKRVIALPDEHLDIRASHIYINGQPLQEPYLPKNQPWTIDNNWPSGAGESDLIPNHDYFVMGDNRNQSTDSRVFGPINVDDIDAHAIFRLWPLFRFGGLGPGSTLP